MFQYQQALMATNTPSDKAEVYSEASTPALCAAGQGQQLHDSCAEPFLLRARDQGPVHFV